MYTIIMNYIIFNNLLYTFINTNNPTRIQSSVDPCLFLCNKDGIITINDYIQDSNRRNYYFYVVPGLAKHILTSNITISLIPIDNLDQYIYSSINGSLLSKTYTNSLYYKVRASFAIFVNNIIDTLYFNKPVNFLSYYIVLLDNKCSFKNTNSQECVLLYNNTTSCYLNLINNNLQFNDFTNNTLFYIIPSKIIDKYSLIYCSDKDYYICIVDNKLVALEFINSLEFAYQSSFSLTLS